jgi:parvulin-like peptidyl-prolyl isomerase
MIPFPRAFAVVVLLAACSGDEMPTLPPVEPPPATPAVPVGAIAAPVAGPRVPAATSARMAASHILVAYAGSLKALPNVTRSREEAIARANEVRAKVLAGGDFAGLAKQYSDDSTGPRGGSLGGFMAGTMVEPFEKATQALPVGGVSEVVDTPFGFHVIRRDALTEVHAKHLLVTWTDAERAPAGVTRSKAEAKARIEEAAAAVAAGTPWAEVVRKYSDGPLKEDGGDLGWFGPGQLAPMLDTAAFDLDIGATSAVVESPRGFHILQRAE